MSSTKERIKCVGCGKEFTLLLSHLERTESCQDSYDMPTMRKENARVTKERKAQRSRERYHNDPEESPRKKAAAKEYYKNHTPEKKAAANEYYEKHTPEKKATMAIYNERNREKINDSMRQQYHDDPEKRQAKAQYYKEQCQNQDKQKCPECDEIFSTKKDINRHIKYTHTGEQAFTCQICEKIIHYSKDSLARHMKEVHGGIKHKCKKCPAAFSRSSYLEEHMKDGFCYLEYQCDLCDEMLLFKHFSGLINHVIVKSGMGKWFGEIPGTTVTCKGHIKSHKIDDGNLSGKERDRRKEEIINEGSKLHQAGEQKQVKLEFKKNPSTHDVVESEEICRYCHENMPFNDDLCKARAGSEDYRFTRDWELIDMKKA